MSGLRKRSRSVVTKDGNIEIMQIECTRCGAKSVRVIVGSASDDVMCAAAARVLIVAHEAAARVDFDHAAEGNGCDHEEVSL